MKPFRPYVMRLHELLIKSSRTANATACMADINAALDGQPSAALRRCVSLTQLRSAGAFFTGSAIARRAIAAGFTRLDRRSAVLDPACGAGDLLVALVDMLPRSADFLSTLADWGSCILGRDLETDFIQATKIRLALAALRRQPPRYSLDPPRISELFPGISAGCSLRDQESYRAATHIVINPPFTLVDAPADCSWGSGKVNSAALFMEACVTRAESRTRIIAILPEVLRSGSRYQKWRKLFEGHVQITKIEIVGQFDRHTDVDVFVAIGLVKRSSTRATKVDWIPQEKAKVERIRDRFDLSVGSVVPYRDPHRGPWFPFIQARELPPWKEFSSVSRHRRFVGRTFETPFVVVRRTSRPGDRHRAVPTLITGRRSVAVENHLIVLKPKDGSLAACRQLLQNLRSRIISEMLDKRIRCRHLTVSSLGGLSWRNV